MSEEQIRKHKTRLRWVFFLLGIGIASACALTGLIVVKLLGLTFFQSGFLIGSASYFVADASEHYLIRKYIDPNFVVKA